MRRIISLVVGSLAFAGCAVPTAPNSADVAKAKSTLTSAANAPTKASPRLASN